jgi:predicted nucleotidyltransferase
MTMMTESLALGVLNDRAADLKAEVRVLRARERDLWNRIAAAAVLGDDTAALRAERHQVQDQLEEHYAAIERIQLATRAPACSRANIRAGTT